jgi:thymidylate synthase
MKQYLDLLSQVRNEGIRQCNRTGIDTLTIPGAMLKFDMAKGFPAMTTKKLAWKAVVGELIGFLRGTDNASDFRALGCNIWDANANQNQQWLDNPNRKEQDDLGRIYGVQWRQWATIGQQNSIDQLQNAINQVRTNPDSRRIIVTAWNPAELDQMALPPCHLLFQLLPHQSTRKLHMVMYQRSCDMFLGVPFNIASYALLLHILSALTNYEPGTLTMMLADVHIYINHLEQVDEQLSRTATQLPSLDMCLPPNRANMSVDEFLNYICPDDFTLLNYYPQAAIKAPMAV